MHHGTYSTFTATLGRAVDLHAVTPGAQRRTLPCCQVSAQTHTCTHTQTHIVTRTYSHSRTLRFALLGSNNSVKYKPRSMHTGPRALATLSYSAFNHDSHHFVARSTCKDSSIPFSTNLSLLLYSFVATTMRVQNRASDYSQPCFD
jgi:hypothetical protein